MYLFPGVQCPRWFPYAFSNGTKCCRNGQEDSSCGGGYLTYSSSCCLDDDQVDCSGENCLSYYEGKTFPELIVQTDT